MLGDILSLSYTIDPRAQGTINLSSSRPIAKRDLLFVMESALRANNLAMVRESGGYRIAPIGDGGVFGPADNAGGDDAAAPGYGSTVIPLRYVVGPTIVRLLDGFAMRPGTVRADPSGRLILVVGTGEERRTALQTVQQFDVDWLRGQSVGLFPIRNSASAAVVSELESIMETRRSRARPRPRQGAGRRGAERRAGRRRAAGAAAIGGDAGSHRLDGPNVSGAGVHVYKVRYGDAKQIAQLLNSMFVGGQGGESDSNQLAPGGGAKQLSVTDRLTGGGSSQSSGVVGRIGGGGGGLGSAPGRAAGSPAAPTRRSARCRSRR